MDNQAADAGDTPSVMTVDAGWRGRLGWVALIAALCVLVFFGIAAIGAKYRLWDPQFGFATLAVGWGSALAIAAVLLGVVSLVLGATKYPRVKPVVLSLAALLVAGSMFGRIWAFGALALGLPPIHDIQTDWSDPVRFSPALMAAREADHAKNPVEDTPVIPESAEARWPGMGGRLVSQVQEEAEASPGATYDDDHPAPPYEPIAPLFLSAEPERVQALVVDLVQIKGWRIVNDMPATAVSEGQVEATATTGWFGFADDIAIRIRPQEGGGTRVDMRSISRVGLSDMGVNALRVSRFLEELRRRAAG